ncbi:6205_t:CDS:1, partial [Acaulospora morrowiae]
MLNNYFSKIKKKSNDNKALAIKDNMRSKNVNKTTELISNEILMNKNSKLSNKGSNN